MTWRRCFLYVRPDFSHVNTVSTTDESNGADLARVKTLLHRSDGRTAMPSTDCSLQETKMKAAFCIKSYGNLSRPKRLTTASDTFASFVRSPYLSDKGLWLKCEYVRFSPMESICRPPRVFPRAGPQAL
jgi:hypothetical protein